MRPGSPELPKKESRELLERVRLVVESKEEATGIVEAFWNAMPHGADLVRSVLADSQPDWSQQLTEGDRTVVSRGILPTERGKFVIVISGNHTPLTKEAVVWLRERGFTG